jgi:hypothetical protein
MRLIEKIREPSSLKILFAVLFLIPFQAILFFPFTIESLDIFFYPVTNLVQIDQILLVGYLVLPIIYCIFISLILNPKRLVNPMYIQIGAFFQFSFFYINNYLEKQPFTTNSLVNLFGGISLVGMYTILISLLQFMIVWWVVALNYKNCDRKSFIINKPPTEVRKLLGKNFLATKHFRKPILLYEKTDNPIIMLKSVDSVGNTIIIAFGSQYNVKNKCILATVAFHKGISWVSNSFRASTVRDSIVNDIKIRLKEKDSRITVSDIENTDDVVSRSVFSQIEVEITSKIVVFLSFLRNMSLYFKMAVLLTLIWITIINYAFFIKQWITMDAYTNIMIVSVIVILFQIGIPLRGEFSLKKADEYF